jgi:hypothetical protein
MRASPSTVQRQSAALKAVGRIKVAIKAGSGGGRQSDEIELVGFTEWLARQRAIEADSSVSQTPDPQNVGGQSVKMTDRGNPSKPTKKRGGNSSLMTDWNKDNRTSNRTKASANSDFEVKGSTRQPSRPFRPVAISDAVDPKLKAALERMQGGLTREVAE